MTKKHYLLPIALLWLLGSCQSDPQDSSAHPAPAAVPETGSLPTAAPTGGDVPSEQQLLERTLRAAAKGEACSEHLKILAAEPHVASSKANRKTANYVVTTLRSYGYRVETAEYAVLLPTPLDVRVEMTRPVAFTASLREEPVDLDFDTHTAGAVLPYNAFSPDCDLEAPVVYANFGRREDYEALSRIGVSAEGRVVIARYGHIYRGSKTELAREHGAAALILYSDPADDGYVRGDVYPTGPFRPRSGVERGSILRIFEYPGDPGTPGRPSLIGTDHLTFESMTSLPELPTTCISHADAHPILQSLTGPNVPFDDWQGGLPFPYHVGNGRDVQVNLHLEFDYSLRSIVNTIATWPGTEFPDETIVIGNHRDAWVHGAVDPGSGTAVLLEAARVLAEQAKAGHPPRRSLVFCTWDAEEFGMIGSTEWGEQHAADLGQRCVAYVNVDAAVSGPELRAAGTPSLSRVLSEIAGDAAGADPKLTVSRLGSGSDYAVFAHHLGIASIDLTSRGSHGVYHSLYDTYSFVKRFADPGFRRHAFMAGLVASFVSRLGNAALLPFQFAAYGTALEDWSAEVEARDPSLRLTEIRGLAADIAATGTSLEALRVRAARVDIATATRLELNGRLYRAERALLDADGLPGRPWYRHALIAPEPDLGYGGAPFPGIVQGLAAKDRDAVEVAATRVARGLRRFLGELRELERALGAIVK